MVYGGAFGAGSGVVKAGVEGSLFGKFNETPLMLRPPTLRPDLVELGLAARPARRTPCVGEPIDVATGAMLMTQNDLSLPASLPLVFERTHLSTYRAGMCFGPTWVSTLDECIQLDADGVVFAAADGMRLVYPVPQAGEPVLPVKGACWPLEWDGKPDGVMTITDPASGVVRSFSSPVPSEALGTVHLPVDSWQDRNGARIDVERTTDGIPTGLRHSGGYYREDCYLTEIRELTSGTRRFDLDGMGRVTGVRAHGWTETYAYDVAGNLTHAAAPAHDAPGDREFEGTLIRRAGRTASRLGAPPAPEATALVGVPPALSAGSLSLVQADAPSRRTATAVSVSVLLMATIPGRRRYR